jgi:hypothetical protein
LALPTAPFIGLPIGNIKPRRLGFAPPCPRGFDRLRIFTVEQQHKALIGRGVFRHGSALDQEPHPRAIGICLVYGQQDRVLGGLTVAPGSVRQECIVPPSPQMRIEPVDALVG